MERLIKYLFRNFKYAGKNVFLKLRDYLPFFVAFFVIQSIFLTIFLTTATNHANRYDKITKKYDYDIAITGLTYNDYIVVDDKLYIMSFMKNRTFESYKISKVIGDFGEEWRIYVVMKNGESAEDFLNYYLYSNEGVIDTSKIKITYTPLYEYRTQMDSYSSSPPLFLLLSLTVVSSLAILTLYDVQVNHDRFRYGIYMTYGAGFRKLVSTSVFEMMTVAVVSLLPSSLFVYEISRAFYGRYGVQTVFTADLVFKVILMSLFVAIIGVILPMKFLSRKVPMKLIIAEDNSNLISSPRKTSFISGARFLKIYELLGMWRFRKYYLKLLLSATAFSAIFICGIYISSMQKVANHYDIEQFKFETKRTNEQILTSDDRYKGYLSDLDFFYGAFDNENGVSFVEYEVSEYAVDSGGMLLLTNDVSYLSLGDFASIRNISNPFEGMAEKLKSLWNKGYTRATYNYKYRAYDRNMLEVIDQRYNVEGDVFSVLENDKTVIVSEKMMNQKKLSFDVGDKIMICRFIEVGAEVEYPDPFDTVTITTGKLSNNLYEFEEYTVGAVIKDMPETEGYFTVGLSYEEYERTTGNTPVPSGASVYLDGDASAETYERVRLKCEQIIDNYGIDFSLTDTYGYLYRTIEMEECSGEFGITLSVLVLSICPLVWFYSQSLFYKKRSKEMYVLSAYGAGTKVFKRIHTVSGVILSGLGFVFTIVVGVVSSYLVFKLMNEWLADIGFGNNVSYEFYISPIAIVACLFLSTLCAFVSSYLPYRKITREMGIKVKTKNKITKKGVRS